MPVVYVFVFATAFFLLSPKLEVFSGIYDHPQDTIPSASARIEEPPERKTTNLKKISLFLVIILGGLFIFGVISYAGIGSFLSDWLDSGLIYALASVAGSGLIYLIWSIKIDQDFRSYEDPKDWENRSDQAADRNLSLATCPKCGEPGYYFNQAPVTTPSTLICWKCGHTFSSVWCDPCGMGGDFVDLSAGKPAEWKCPQCNQIYPLPAEFYENPIQLDPWESLEKNAQTSFSKRQKKFRKSQARTSSWFLASLIIAFTTMQPMMNSIHRAVTKYNVKLLSGEVAYLFLDMVSMLVFFTITWYILLLIPFVIQKLFSQSMEH